MKNQEISLEEIRDKYLNRSSQNINSLLSNNIQLIEKLRFDDEAIGGIPTGFPSLDRLTFGWQPSDLVVIASRPSVGKTTFALNLAINAVLHTRKPTSVAFFSLEMNATQIVQRILSSQSEIFFDKICRGKLGQHEMKQLYLQGIERLSNTPIYIDDSAALNIKELVQKCWKQKNENNIGLIFIDYIQLMSGTTENSTREQEISLITRELKSLAKQLNIPIIALSQLTRDIEKRKDGAKIPQLSDLRDSGSIEQDADVVIFLYRPEYFDITFNEMGDNNQGETYLKVAKHRNGMLDTIKLKNMPQIQKFIENDYYLSPLNTELFKAEPKQCQKKEAKLYIEKGSKLSKMNDGNFDDEAPF